MSVTIRPAAADDAAAIAAIYNEGIADRQATFETVPRSSDDFAGPISDPASPPFLVAATADDVLGWARLTAYSTRDCYSGVGEASIYVGRASRGQGVGHGLLDELTSTAERSGFWKLLALVFPVNEASVGLFTGAGWREVGVHLRHGRLDGEWRDVVVMERLLGEAAG